MNFGVINLGKAVIAKFTGKPQVRLTGRKIPLPVKYMSCMGCGGPLHLTVHARAGEYYATCEAEHTCSRVPDHLHPLIEEFIAKGDFFHDHATRR